MTSLAYGLDVPYEVQLEYDAATSTNRMTILEPQRSPGQPATRHLLTPGVYMVSLSYNGAATIALRHDGGDLPNVIYVPSGTAGSPRTSAPIKISVQGIHEYLQVTAPSTGESAQATISVIPAATFDEMAESTQGVSVLSEISNLKTTLDARVPADMSLRLDTRVGTRVFAGGTMIYGDTGSRGIDQFLVNGWRSNVDGWPVRVRRIGDSVEVRGYLHKENATSSTFLELPEGFGIGHLAPKRAHGIVTGTATTDIFHLRVTERELLIPRYEDWNQNQMHFTATWTTTEEWPSRLP